VNFVHGHVIFIEKKVSNYEEMAANEAAWLHSRHAAAGCGETARE
jgi:hypothetical protein